MMQKRSGIQLYLSLFSLIIYIFEVIYILFIVYIIVGIVKENENYKV